MPNDARIPNDARMPNEAHECRGRAALVFATCVLLTCGLLACGLLACGPAGVAGPGADAIADANPADAVADMAAPGADALASAPDARAPARDARSPGPDTAATDAARSDLGPTDAALPDEGRADAADPADAPADATLADARTPDAGPRCAVEPGPPWTRRLPRVGGVLVFTELSLSAEGGPGGWLELHNTLSIEVDLSGWRLSEAVDFEFPEGTLVPGGGDVVVHLDAPPSPDALGPAFGALSANGFRLALHTHFGRMMDSLEYTAREPWPVAPAPGHTLAKPAAEAPSPAAESWGWSAEPGGTPGAPNAGFDPDPGLVAEPRPDTADVVLNEIHYHPADDAGAEYVELYNRGAAAVDLSGWQLVDAVAARFPAGTVLPPGAFAVVTGDAVAFRGAYPGVPVAAEFVGSLTNGGETLVLRDACGAVVDRVRYADGGRFPVEPDGGGSSLELRDARADNGLAESWAASDEAPRVPWQSVVYRGVAAPSPVGPDGQWHEFVLGLLDAGEVLLDDLQVIEDPDGAAFNLLQNGSFDAGDAGAWRFLGTHAGAEVVPDPDDPSNPVLRLVATGPAEHMHNHVETTLAGGRGVNNGATYEIRYRARWRAGSNQLNTRLYFNRLARTLRLDRPAAVGTPGAANSTRVDNAGPTFRGLRHSPVVPAPDQPVTVSVDVDDPDGVARVLLFAAVEGGGGGGFALTPMVAGPDGRYTGVLPGYPAGTRVQFYVGAEDARGASATFPARGAASRAMFRVEEPLPAPRALRGLRILMTEADSARFHDPTEVMSNASTPVTVIADDREVFYDVGVRAKGSERGRPMQPRLGFSIRFGPERPLRGVFPSVSVDRSEGVIYGQRELLMDHVMTRAGNVSAEYNDLIWLDAPRAEHTGPALLQAARFSDALLDAQFEDGSDGELFEYELVYYPLTTDDGTPEGRKRPQPDGVVGTALRDLGEDPEAWRHNFLLKNNRAGDDFGGIMGLGRLFGSFGPDFDTNAESVLDVDQWLRAFAFSSLSGAIDHYEAGAQHNAQFYVRPDDGRVLFFPHDLDFYPGDPHSAVVGSADLGRLLAIAGNRRRFYGHLHDILDRAYAPPTLARWRDQFAVLLPDQAFASHHDFMAERARWIGVDAPDSVRNAIPLVDFAVTTNGGADLSIDGEQVLLQGTAWLDTREIRRLEFGEVIPVRFTGDTTWEAEFALEPGFNPITLEAVDYRGRPLGLVGLTVERLESGLE